MEASYTSIPSIFCWTKVGSEAGQTLPEILYRKEMERRVGGGTFCWGIGNSLGQALKLARTVVPEEEIEILFTTMKGAAKAIDESPPGLLLWLSYWDDNGELNRLPTHMVVSSRRERPSGHTKKNHYALLCSSNQQLRLMEDKTNFDAALTRNFVSYNNVGSSQVTALVRYSSRGNVEQQKPYRVAFRAKFHDVGFVKLAEPVVIQDTIAKLYAKLNATESVKEWEIAVGELKSEARSKLV